MAAEGSGAVLPDDRASFRKDNAAALQAANRGFVRTLHRARSAERRCGGDRRGVLPWRCEQGEHRDGGRLVEQLAALDQRSRPDGVALDANDAAEDAMAVEPSGAVSDRLAALEAKRAAAQAALDRLAASGETQVLGPTPMYGRRRGCRRWWLQRAGCGGCGAEADVVKPIVPIRSTRPRA